MGLRSGHRSFVQQYSDVNGYSFTLGIVEAASDAGDADLYQQLVYQNRAFARQYLPDSWQPVTVLWMSVSRLPDSVWGWREMFIIEGIRRCWAICWWILVQKRINRPEVSGLNAQEKPGSQQAMDSERGPYQTGAQLWRGRCVHET